MNSRERVLAALNHQQPDRMPIDPGGTPEELAREVEQNIRIFAPGGGYVLGAVHNIQARVPPENVIALFDTALSAGQYRMLED